MRLGPPTRRALAPLPDGVGSVGRGLLQRMKVGAMKRLRGSLGLLLAAALFLLFASSCVPAGTSGTRKDVAPDFSLPTLDGGAGNLRDYRGRTVIVTFWASWCGPCRAQIPDMQAAYTELRDRGLVVIGINQGESREHVAAFVREFRLTYPILLDENQSIGRKYGVRAYPTTFFIDREGVIQEVIVGGPLTRNMIRRQVEGMLR